MANMNDTDEATPAYATTHAPEAAHAATDVGADDCRPRRGPLSFLACVVVLVAILSLGRTWVLVSLCALLPLAMVAGWAACSA